MNFRKILPHIVAVVVFIAASFIYFSPVLNNKQLMQSDMSQFAGISKSVDDYHKQSGNYSEWTNSMFGGMPAYQIENSANGNIMEYLAKPLTLGSYNLTVGVMFLMALGFYVFMIAMGANPWMSIFAGLVYALGSYNIIIIGVGHITKAWAMSMIAPIFAGMILVLRKKYLPGSVLFVLALGLQLTFNHIQITYYTLIGAVILGICYLIFAVKDKEYKEIGKSFAVLVLGAFLALMPTLAHIMINKEYVDHTMRGGSELTVKANDNNDVNKDGLSIDYAFRWSYSKDETMTLLIPDYKGGGSADARVGDENAKIRQQRNAALQETANKATSQEQIDGLNQVAGQYMGSTYFGTQPFTAGPVYFGSIVIFLSLLGFIILDNKWRWWLLAATVVSILLSWGSNFMALNSWLFYHLPYFNKFRTPSMALVLANVTMCIAAFMGLKAFLENKEKKNNLTALYIAGGVTMLVCLLCAVAPDMFTDFSSASDERFSKALGQGAIFALQEDRKAIFTADAWRSFLFIAVAFIALWLYSKDKLKNSTVIFCIIGLAAIIDLWGVAKRYVNDDSFRSKGEMMVVASNAENSIMEKVSQQNIAHYRVYNLTVSPFNDASTSYFMPSIGGYSAVKLQRYQDIIDFYFTNTQYHQNNITDTALLMRNPMRQLLVHYAANPNFPMPNIGVLNMLDTRYIILSNDQYLENTEALGAAWFVNNIDWAKNADEEITKLNNFDPKQTVVINKKYADIVKPVANPDPEAKIEFVPQQYNSPEKVVYKTSSKTDRIAVFSEIFYEDSWHCTIDGKEAKYFCADYILRGIYVPAGSHTIEFTCHSDTLATGRIYSTIGSVLVVLLVAFAIGWPIYNKRKNRTTSK